MTRLYVNNFSTTITSVLSDASATVELASVAGLPSITPPDYMTLTLADSLESPVNIEIVKVTGITGSVLNIERGQEGTTPSSFSSGAFIEGRATATSFDGDKSYNTLDEALADTKVTVGQRFSVANYSDSCQSGVLFFEWVTAGTGIDDGGSYIDHDSLGLQAKQNFNKLGVAVEQFDVTGGLSADGASNDAAIANALTYASSSRLPLLTHDQFYVFTDTIDIPDGVAVRAGGVDLWDTIFPSVAKGWGGTSFVFKGTGPKDHFVRGVTSMKHAGGWVEDPDSAGEYIKLNSFMNDDASGATAATPKLFSCAVKLGHYSQLKDVRVVPWYGTDGYSDYSNQTATGLSDEWDVGILRDDTNGAIVENVQVVGHWRIAASLDISGGYDEFGRSERGVSRDCVFEGVTGFSTRAGDVWAVEGSTSSTISVYWSDEHYWASSGQFRGNDGVYYTYTGLTYSAPNLTFTGVTPDPSSLFEVRNPKTGTGFAGDQAENCMFYTLSHVNGNESTSFGLPISKAMEASGFPLRGQKYYNCKGQTHNDRCVGFLHDVDDMRWTDGQFEGGAYLIASPAESDSSAVAARGQCKNLRLTSSLISGSVDRRLFTPRSVYNDYEQFSDEFDLGGNTIVSASNGGVVKVIDNNGDTFFSTEHKSWTPSFFLVATPTYTIRSGSYTKIGNMVMFAARIEWSGLDTADVSSIQIRVPDGSVVSAINGSIQSRLSTGLVYSAPITLDIISSNYICFTDGDLTPLAYNTGEIQASGALYISGTYWIES